MPQPLVDLPLGRGVRTELQVLVVVHGRLALGQVQLVEPADLRRQPRTKLVVLTLNRPEAVGALKKTKIKNPVKFRKIRIRQIHKFRQQFKKNYGAIVIVLEREEEEKIRGIYVFVVYEQKRTEKKM